MRRLRVLLDANVLVDAQLRDLFCRLAEADLITVHWSSLILAETRRALTGPMGLDPAKVDRLVDTLDRAFPEAAIDILGLVVDPIELPDPDDRHVLATAAAGECDWLITGNVDDFPEETAESVDVLVLTADDALGLLARWYRDLIGPIVDLQIAALRRPTLTREEFLKRLAQRAPLGAISIGAALGIEEYQRMFAETLDAEPDDSPQGAVRRLLAAVEAGDVQHVGVLVDDALARRLTGVAGPSPSQLLDALASALADVHTTEGWGFATGRRPQTPDVELVKLLRLGTEPLIAFEPQAAPRHLFSLERRASRWVLIDLDGPDPALDQP